MGRTRKSLRKKQNKNEVPESTPDQDRVQQHLSPDLEVQPNIINDSISGLHINAERQNTDINVDNIDFRFPDPNAHISVSEVMHVMSQTMENNNCLTQTLTNVLKELPKKVNKSVKGDLNLPRSQSVRIDDEFSSDEDTEIYDPRLRSYDRASSLDRPSTISLNSKFKVKLPIFSGIESWKVWFSRFTEVADRRGWNKDDRLDELLQRLHGQAGDFAYGQLSRRVRQDYDLLIDELNSRYRVIETSKTFGVKFSHKNQHPHESVEEYAAELKRLYDQAYPARDRQTGREVSEVTKSLPGSLFNFEKKASIPYLFEDGRDIVKQSHSESQKHWAFRSGIRIKSFPKPIKPTIPIFTATPIPIAPKPLAPLETSTIISSAASIDSYSRLLQSNMPSLSMPKFSNYSVAQTATSYCPPVVSSRESSTVTKIMYNAEAGSLLSRYHLNLLGDEVECPDDIVTNNDNNNDQNNNHIDLTTSSSFPEAQVSDVQTVDPVVQQNSEVNLLRTEFRRLSGNVEFSSARLLEAINGLTNAMTVQTSAFNAMERSLTPVSRDRYRPYGGNHYNPKKNNKNKRFRD
ncbi:unnamed protein product [Mytilus edulis]|uniref:Retrotransposon gag domain-containing protein n=1 Tax=Mytilus edulis TaxID=6550 RepID=A0A8S3QK00_MYTED|nr:unnamed protein product [Mytilus edulis]